ncbi:MAG: tRNA (guanosine(37)-N1)-methyltransferase TrmD [Nanoarchaeota archaeon]|nr:tRNA (guanosine(37)-N1)-methyltransferase TrmD [Nanoarchaeota archaeon]
MKKQIISFHIISIFPESMRPYADSSILKRAQEKKLIHINFINPRDFTDDAHNSVDDSPYGGGPGMVMKVEPIYKAVQKIGSRIKDQGLKKRIILFSTRGKLFTQKEAKRLVKYDHLILICGRYEGVDERVAKYIADEEISIGDYVLSGGELPAMVVVEAVSRHIPGVLGKYESLEDVKGSYPVYTRPEVFQPNKRKSWKAPKILLSGDHKKIEGWRKTHND